MSSTREPDLPHRRRTRVVLACIGLIGVVVVAVVSSGPARSPLRDAHRHARPTTASVRDQSVATTDPDGGLPPLAPTVASPLRVVEIGDSLGIDLGDQLQSQLDATGVARTTMASVGDSGLANLSFYDWPAHLATLLDSDRPQIVVVFIGANDDQGLYVGGTPAAPGTLPWVVDYAQRVDDMVTEATSAGARVVWVGMPHMANPDLDAAVQREDAIFERETEPAAGTLYLPSDLVLDRASGRYQSTGVDPSGHQVTLRTPDGVHLTAAGASALAHAVIGAMDDRWHLSLGEEAPPGGRTTG